MIDTRELYQQIILDHNRNPRNFREIETATCHAEGNNPLCGDVITVYLAVVDNTVSDVSFQGAGCAISTASASLMTEAIRGRNKQEAVAVLRQFEDLVTTGIEMPDAEGLEIFAGVRYFPSRIKCATLAWHTLGAALEGTTETVSTE